MRAINPFMVWKSEVQFGPLIKVFLLLFLCDMGPRFLFSRGLKCKAFFFWPRNVKLWNSRKKQSCKDSPLFLRFNILIFPFDSKETGIEVNGDMWKWRKGGEVGLVMMKGKKRKEKMGRTGIHGVVMTSLCVLFVCVFIFEYMIFCGLCNSWVGDAFIRNLKLNMCPARIPLFRFAYHLSRSPSILSLSQLFLEKI